MRVKVLGILHLALTATLLVSCNYYHPKGVTEGGLEGGPNTGEPGKEGGGGGGEPTPATFASISTAVFTPYCSRCHKGDEPAGDIDITAYEPLVKDGLIVPGKPDESMIYTTMIPDEDGVVAMPKRGAKPSAELIEAVKVWIENGALEK